MQYGNHSETAEALPSTGGGHCPGSSYFSPAVLEIETKTFVLPCVCEFARTCFLEVSIVNPSSVQQVHPMGCVVAVSSSSPRPRLNTCVGVSVRSEQAGDVKLGIRMRQTHRPLPLHARDTEETGGGAIEALGCRSRSFHAAGPASPTPPSPPLPPRVRPLSMIPSLQIDDLLCSSPCPVRHSVQNSRSTTASGYKHPDFWLSSRPSRCLFVVRTNGGSEDFSYRKCVQAYVKRTYPTLPHADRFLQKRLFQKRS